MSLYGKKIIGTLVLVKYDSRRIFDKFFNCYNFNNNNVWGRNLSMSQSMVHKRWFKSLGILLMILSLPLIFLGWSANNKADASTISKSVSGWIAYWDQTRGFSVVQNNKDIFDEISPFWYDLGSTGELKPLWNSEDATIISWAKSNGVKIIPLISNEFDGNLVSSVINNSTVKQTHINNIVDKVVTMGYDGIEIDYENLLATDKDAFSAFIRDLATALHGKGKVLVVTVHPKTEPIGTWGGPKAQDYVTLGQAADKIRIMAYDYHWSGGTPGSIAPSTWVDQVLAYSVTAIPKSKVVLGVPNYGYDWGTTGKGITYEQAMATANTYGALITQDPLNGPHYIYYDSTGVKHEVWFENTMSLNTKLDLVNKYDINGISIWRLGGEDATNYQAIRDKFPIIAPAPTPIPEPTPAPAPAPDTTAPTLSFAVNVTKTSVAMNATATDNVKVAKVMFYVDGTLKYTDTTSPYSYSFKVRRTNKTHTVKVVAVDSSGNQTTVSKSVIW